MDVLTNIILAITVGLVAIIGVVVLLLFIFTQPRGLNGSNPKPPGTPPSNPRDKGKKN